MKKLERGTKAIPASNILHVLGLYLVRGCFFFSSIYVHLEVQNPM